MSSLGFENYAEALKIYLSKYREVGPLNNYSPISEYFVLIPNSSPSPTAARTNRTGPAARATAPRAARIPRAVSAPACRASPRAPTRRATASTERRPGTTALGRTINLPGLPDCLVGSLEVQSVFSLVLFSLFCVGLVCLRVCISTSRSGRLSGSVLCIVAKAGAAAVIRQWVQQGFGVGSGR